MSRIKKNTIKKVTCPRCNRVVHRGDITQYVAGQQVDTLAYCQHCGNYWIANTQSKDKTTK